MADSNITKRALAAALKELMAEMPFEKINVAQICERCNMNRKSFYYHFKDKYDLVNWIFDTEFIMIAKQENSEQTYEDRLQFFRDVCNYFFENRTFYRKALQIKGQNSFSEHFRDYIQPLTKNRIIYLITKWGDSDSVEIDEFTIDFLSDAMMCALERWLLSKDCMPAELFVNKFIRLIEVAASLVQLEMEETTKNE